MLIVFAASVLYILFHTPLFRKIPLIYIVAGIFITSVVVIPILFRFIIINVVIDIFLLAYIWYNYQNRKVGHTSKHGNVSAQIDRIEHAAKNLSFPFYYYVTIALFLLLVVAYILSEHFLNLCQAGNFIFSDTGRTMPSVNYEFDSYPLVILWILIISTLMFCLKKIFRNN